MTLIISDNHDGVVGLWNCFTHFKPSFIFQMHRFVQIKLYICSELIYFIVALFLYGLIFGWLAVQVLDRVVFKFALTFYVKTSKYCSVKIQI